MNPFIQAASIPGVFRLLIIILVVYVLYSLLVRYIIPSMMRKYISDFQKRFTEQNQRTQDEMNRKKEGEISIKYVNKDKSSNKHPDDGEYIDYEEIK